MVCPFCEKTNLPPTTHPINRGYYLDVRCCPNCVYRLDGLRHTQDGGKRYKELNNKFLKIYKKIKKALRDNLILKRGLRPL